MAIAKRIFLFIVTNLLVMVTISIVWTLLSSFLGIRMDGGTAALMLFSLVWGMGGAFISLLISKWSAKMMMGVEIIEPNTLDPEHRPLVDMIHDLARKAGLSSMPEVGIYESPDINAFATGPSQSNSLVAVSTGLLQRMNRDEIEGVLGHEISHIANGDMVTMTLIQGVVNAFVIFFSRVVARIIAESVEERSRSLVYFIANIVSTIAFTMLGALVVNYFSRYREFRADAGSANIAGKQKMISALKRLQANFEPQENSGNDNLATLKISDGNHASLFSTHPSLADRIAALEANI